MDSPADILLRFTSLDKNSRQTILQGLLDHLYHDEWRQLRDRLNSKTFQCDILGSLPVELVAQIAKYLGLSDIVVLQRVSKQWRFLLSSPLIQSTVLRGRDGVPLFTADSHDSFTHHARRRIRLERGHPFSEVHYESPCKTNSHSPLIMDYSRGRCAWVELGDDGRCLGVALRDLRSGSVQHFYTENRVPLVQVRVSDTIVATVSVRGSWYVWNHHTGETASFRLPSMHHDFFLVSNQTIAFGFDGNALVCDSPSRIVHSVAVPPGMVFMALDSTGGFITVHISGGTDQQAEVEADSDSESESNYVPIDDARLLVSRYSMNGSLPPSFVSSTLLPIPDPNHFSNIPDHSTDLALAKNTTLLTLSNNKLGVLTVARRQNRQIHCFFFLSHDPLSNRLSLHPSPADYNLASPVAPIGRNLLYYLKFDAWRPYIRICNSDESPPFTHSRYMYTRRVSADITSSSYAIDGDGEFVLLIDRDGVTAWCFDELASLAPAGSGG